MTEIVRSWSHAFGLATAPLFGGTDEQLPPGEHAVMLDGGYGTFALSTSTEELWRTGSPAAWAWSSDIPHHVTVTDDKVAVLRWDQAFEPRVYERKSVERSLTRFYDYLNNDRLRSNRSVVSHLLGYFRRLRSLSHEARLPDNRATDVFTAALARLVAPNEAEANPNEFGLAADASALCAAINPSSFAAAAEETVRTAGSLSLLQLYPALAVRHAGGQLFQEAHFELLRVSPDYDLFGLLDAPEVRADSRGGTHFTPPALARSIVEQALASISAISTRRTLTICDPACGSGAFLHEALRALRHLQFKGSLRIIGYDISQAAVSMSRFALAMSLRDWSPPGGATIELRVGDSLGALGMPKADVIVMNPPFIAAGAQTPMQREQLRAAVGTTAARGDYSMAFVARALEALNDGGVLGALFPASLLSLNAASSWREQLASTGQMQLLASIGEFGLFTHALGSVEIHREFMTAAER